MNQTSRTYLISIGMLLILFALLIVGSRHVSITTDEMLHVGFGYTYLARGQDSFWIIPFRGQPPLLNAAEALLPYLANPDLPLEEMNQWGRFYGPFVSDLVFQLFGVEQAQMGWFRFDPPLTRPQLTYSPQPILTTRIPIIFLTVLLGAIVFRWAKDLWGPTAGLAALFALCFDPMMLGHGRLANTDVGTVVLGTAALYVTWRWTRRPAWPWAAGSGALLGLTMLSKSSGVLWTAGAGVIILGKVIFSCRDKRGQLLVQGIATGVLGLFLVWAAYGFSVGPLEGISVPIPAPEHWYSIFHHASGAARRQIFALGLRTTGRLWWYFPLAFAVKNPIPLLVGVVAGGAGAVCLKKGLRSPRTDVASLEPADDKRGLSESEPGMVDHGYERDSLPIQIFIVGFFPLFYAGLAVVVGINIGYRHMLPLHPFLCLLVGAGAYIALRMRSKWPRWLVASLAIWLIVETLVSFPNEIAYFNQLVGGPEEGYRYLSDSNVEWGQSSHLLYAYADDHPDAIIGPPEHRLLPEAGHYVVNAAQLQGSNISDRYAYEWFRYREPTSRLNEGLLIYDIPPAELDWLAQCTIPDVPLQAEIVADEISIDSLRRVFFDCTAAWLYPGGGESAGLYALHHELAGAPVFDWRDFTFVFPLPDDAFAARRLAGAGLAFEHDVYEDQLPAFLMYEVDVDEEPSPPASMHSLALGDGSESGPVPLENGLTFIGAAAYPAGDQLEVETWWQVTEGPIVRPLSIMAHLLGPDGHPLAVADGLGVSPLAFQPGDILVQRHIFPSSTEEGPLWLQTGVYWLDEMELWHTLESPQSDAVFVPLDG
jgi:hypothetical protein